MKGNREIMFDDNIYLNDIDFDIDGLEIYDFNMHDISITNTKVDAENTEVKIKTKVKKTIDRHLLRRFTSEKALEDSLHWYFEEGYCYHVISNGDIDSLSYLKFILRQQPLEYCLLSTWCMALHDIQQINVWIIKGVIKKMDCYVGEIFKGSYANEYIELCKVMKKCGGRVCIFRNHAKVFAGFGDKFCFTVESSANVNTNPRCENTVITINRELAYFYKEFFDSIKSFERNFDNWNPYAI